MIKPIIPIGYSATQAEIDNGDFNAKTGGYIMVVNASGQDTGARYEVGGVGQSPTLTVSQSGSGGYEKVQITTSNYALKPNSSGLTRIFHVETGTLKELVITDWPVPSSPQVFYIQNHKGTAVTFSANTGVGQFSGVVDFDGDEVEDNQFSIKKNTEVKITIDQDGWIQVAASGSTYTKPEIDTALLGKVDTVTGKGLSTVDFTTAKDTKLSGIAAGATANDTDANLKNRANHTGSQAQSTVTNLTTDLGLKAPLASPAFTGTPTGITKAHVGLGSVDNTADSAKPVSTAQQTALDLKAPIASPTFTGTPLSTTPIVDTNTTQVATTAWVNSQLSGTLPVMNGTATVGTGNRSVRGNHVHPTDTSKQNTLVSGTNVKTVNGQSIVGAGDVPITGATSIATQNSTTPIQGTGGTITLANGVLETVHKFTASGTFVVPAGVTSVQALVVGGGAGGAGGVGGGGGGGRLVENAALAVTPGASHTVTIGVGGTGGSAVPSSGGAGGISSLGTLVIATGGGGGGSNNITGNAGGSGGGGGSSQAGGAAQAGTSTGGDVALTGYGFAGGTGADNGSVYEGAGGGGAGAVGANGNPNGGTGGDGGAGRNSTITGSTVGYAGGGGGGTTGGQKGTATHGGGSLGVAGDANTGGGGGSNVNSVGGGAGGTGIVIVRYTHTYTQEPVIPIYADNTAAIAGGLAVGAMYRTSAGVLNVRY